MVLSDKDFNMHGNDFYSPMCVSGYLTPLQRKKLREKRNTPLTSDFEADFKTPKSSSKDTKKPKRPSSSKLKPKVKTPKEQQIPKSSKENPSELRYSVARLVAQGTSDGSNKEKRFFKNRSPQHLQKTEFVMPLSYKKRSLDFSGEKKNLLLRQPIEPCKQSSSTEATDLKSKGNPSQMCQPTMIVPINEYNPISGTPKGKVLAPVSPCNNIELTSVKESKIKPIHHPMKIDFANINHPIDGTPKRKVRVCEEQSFPVNDEHVDEVIEFRKNTTEVRMGEDVFSFEWPSDEELMNRQNNARAKLKKALSVGNVKAPVLRKSVINVSDVHNAFLDEVDIQKNDTPKLYPIFNNLKTRKTESKSRSIQKRTSLCIRDTSKGEEQMIIDAGQREIGSKVCKTCNMLYTIGHEEDERLHYAYHDTFLVNLRFPGWKNECIVGEFDDGRVIKILDTDKNFKLRKVEDVLYIANRDLGFPTAGCPSKPNVMFFLFISNDKRVGGCLVAESIKSACPVVLEESANTDQNADEKPIWKLGNWYASTKPVKAICGINRIWVAVGFRRQKVASRLIDCLRGSFIYGHVVDCREMAFTDPSPDGRGFAAAYTGTDNFLVYK